MEFLPVLIDMNKAASRLVEVIDIVPSRQRMMNSQKVVTPVKTGVQGNRNLLIALDSELRRHEENPRISAFCEFIKDG